MSFCLCVYICLHKVWIPVTATATYKLDSFKNQSCCTLTIAATKQKINPIKMYCCISNYYGCPSFIYSGSTPDSSPIDIIVSFIVFIPNLCPEIMLVQIPWSHMR